MINNIDISSNISSNIFTCVTGYWKVKNKYDKTNNEDKYKIWFNNTLAINCPYIFFTSNTNIDIISNIRKDYKTYLIDKDIKDFKSYSLNIKNNIHPLHIPSKEIGLIWLEKINLVLEASIINPYNSEWFCWIDAGISVFRNKTPPNTKFPNPIIIDNLLSKNKINYNGSNDIKKININAIKYGTYLHNVSGGFFIIHISIIKEIHKLFYEYLDKCIKSIPKTSFVCYSEQYILSRICLDHPELFNKIGDNYSTELLKLF